MGSTESASILIVDDTPENLRVLMSMLSERGHRVRPVMNGALALRAALLDPPDLILLDINMPEMDGYEICRRLKAIDALRDIPVLFISALSEAVDKVRAFGVGGVDYITKPFQFEEVQARVETHFALRRLRLQLEDRNKTLSELVEEKVREVGDSQLATIFALVKLAESRDDDTGQHVERIQAFSRMLALQLREEPAFADRIDGVFVDNIHYASSLHDVGKVAISDTILLKPGRLTAEEFEVMKTHALLGAQTLEAVQQKYTRNAVVAMGIDIARSHHEKWDGSGYPHGLHGEEIPLAARIVAVADVYDALRARRVYKEPFTHEKSVDIIREGRGRHFDPAVVAAFEAKEAEFRAACDAQKRVETPRRPFDAVEEQGSVLTPLDGLGDPTSKRTLVRGGAF